MLENNQESTAFFDLETLSTFQELYPGKVLNKDQKKQAIEKLGLSTACIITDKPSQKVTFFEQGQERQCIEELLRFDKIVGHNLMEFDYLVLKPFLKTGELETLQKKTIDTFIIIRNLTGEYAGLDDLCKRNFGKNKTEDALKVPSMWRAGKKAEVKEYCQHDVELVKELYTHGKNKSIKYFCKKYYPQVEKEIKVSW